jgi:RNA polymerase sigma-70 factor (ECF subfamily)
MEAGTARRAHERVRWEADRLEGAKGSVRFHRRRTLDHSPRSERLVLAAIDRAKAGDEAGLRLLYLQFANNVYGYVCSLVHDEHDAEDVTQQLFAKLVSALPKYEPQAAPFSAWILRVAHHVAIDYLRIRQALPCEEVRSAHEEDQDVSHERRCDLRDALEKLPEDQREVVVLRFIIGLSPQEIADRLGRSPDAVYGLTHRGRRSLEAELTRTSSAPATLRLSRSS